MIDPAISEHYSTGYERDRLFPGGQPALEFVRSLELLAQLLPEPPAQLLDVGGGPGTYASPLASRGYQVHLVDPVPVHVRQALEAADTGARAAFSAEIGDARDLPAADRSQDAVLLFGPLYHLTTDAGRRRALAEAYRVLRPGGRVLAMAISRFASLLDGLFERFLDDPQFTAIVAQDLADGQHRNPGCGAEYFTTAYFHTPAGLATEVATAGFGDVSVFGVEGPGGPLRRDWQDPVRRDQILFAARAAQSEPSLLGFSYHLIAAGTKPWQKPAPTT